MDYEDIPGPAEGEESRRGGSLLDAAFPVEPFACPACGQMLAPTVRICVACQQPIDRAKIKRPQRAVAIRGIQLMPPHTERAVYSWRILFTVVAAWFLTAAAGLRLLGHDKTTALLAGVVLFSSAWVLFDAKNKGVPKPLRWALGSLLLWIVFFPWYLSRRRTPRASCPVEAEPGPVARAFLLVLLVFFLLGVVVVIFRGPVG